MHKPGIPLRLLILDGIGTLLLVLVALKIGMDIMLHRRSHRRQAASDATAAATDSTP